MMMIRIFMYFAKSWIIVFHISIEKYDNDSSYLVFLENIGIRNSHMNKQIDKLLLQHLHELQQRIFAGDLLFGSDLLHLLFTTAQRDNLLLVLGQRLQLLVLLDNIVKTRTMIVQIDGVEICNRMAELHQQADEVLQTSHADIWLLNLEEHLSLQLAHDIVSRFLNGVEGFDMTIIIEDHRRGGVVIDCLIIGLQFNTANDHTKQI